MLDVPDRVKESTSQSISIDWSTVQDGDNNNIVTREVNNDSS